MANQLYPNVNDEEISWSNISLPLAINGGVTLDVTDCEGIKWSTALETGLSYGTSGGRPMKETNGKVKYTASMMLTKSGILALKTALGAVAPVRGNQKLISQVRFSVQVLYKLVSNPSTVYETVLRGCRFRGESEDAKEGVDAIINEIPLDPIEIVDVISGSEYALL